jgi:V/A-type H+/Na+-transporting ATPase subunit A
MLKPGAPVRRTGAPLSAAPGPGIGRQHLRRHPAVAARHARASGAWIIRGEKVPPLDVEKRWTFSPRPGRADGRGRADSGRGARDRADHASRSRPPGRLGHAQSLAPAGEYTIRDVIAVVDTPAGPRELTMVQQLAGAHAPADPAPTAITEPLVTGQRIIDALFPIGKGGAAAIPGGFGTGKTITQHQLAKWSNADLIVYVGCGERGNEMTDVLQEFPKIEDPESGRP